MPIRWLKPGDEVPRGKPHRYTTSHGYIRLRWHGADGPGRHVEVYEHRIQNGRVIDGHGHHRNGVKTDNGSGNVVALSPAAHCAEHRTVDRAEAVRRYESGESTPAIAETLGCTAAALSKILRAEGVTMRRGSGNRRYVDPERLRELHATGARVPAIAIALGVPEMSVRRAMRELELPGFPAGRPQKAGLEPGSDAY